MVGMDRYMLIHEQVHYDFTLNDVFYLYYPHSNSIIQYSTEGVVHTLIILVISNNKGQVLVPI